ncbi:MAG: ABC transporter ATP-binding protein [Candidatus Omnitrophica bacterium]|nr:Sulfate/thiosulfate import ATP-binding protein CysA [bacterium]NUN96817.1 ABC transporter ATP-binding protein [Candidatus Omnitrophota bacterium]
MIEVSGLAVHAGQFRLSEIRFSVPTGGYAVLMGRTGTGKTTLLEALCGLKHVSGGTIRLMGRDVTRLKPAQRGIGFVPQEAALFSTMTVREHLAFALTIRRADEALIRERVSEMSEVLGIGHLLDRRPSGLSGGERQRVALGRALAHHPPVLCLDEPLSALDEETREEMYALLEQVRGRTGVTTLHVTHNLSDAERLADRILLLRDGVIIEKDGVVK